MHTIYVQCVFLHNQQIQTNINFKDRNPKSGTAIHKALHVLLCPLVFTVMVLSVLFWQRLIRQQFDRRNNFHCPEISKHHNLVSITCMIMKHIFCNIFNIVTSLKHWLSLMISHRIFRWTVVLINLWHIKRMSSKCAKNSQTDLTRLIEDATGKLRQLCK